MVGGRGGWGGSLLSPCAPSELCSQTKTVTVTCHREAHWFCRPMDKNREISSDKSKSFYCLTDHNCVSQQKEDKYFGGK